MRYHLLPLLLAMVCMLPTCGLAQSIQHCVQRNGTAVFTDRRCEDLGAADRRYRPSAPLAQATTQPQIHLQCPRRYQDMIERVDAAVASGNVNQLGALYLWSGLSTASANRVMDRLEALVHRPLLDIQLVMSSPAPVMDADAALDGQQPLDLTPPRTVVGLELRQAMIHTPGTSSTVLGLHHAYNCLWIGL